jgi:membrane protease subunit (stomatin/prohibitin family)
MWDRIKHGGTAAKDQRIYYFNMKELVDNKFGTQNPVPFRMTYPDLGRSFTVGVRCNGIYSYRIADPVVFYVNVCGNVTDRYTRSELDNQLRGEFVDALQPAFAAISATGIRYDELPGKQNEVKQAFETQVNPMWIEKRGLKIWSVSILSATVSDADMKRIQEFEDRAWNRDPGNAAATLVEAQAQAMQNAASNPNGAAMGLFGMGMAQQAGGMNAQALFGMAQQNQAQQPQAPQAPVGGGAPAADSWTCECGASNTGKFCATCGKPKPVVLTADGWTCDCGSVNKGKFCSNCGKKKPEGAPLYKCDKCGWEPEDPMNPPKFCPECGDPFTDDDIVK